MLDVTKKKHYIESEILNGSRTYSCVGSVNIK